MTDLPVLVISNDPLAAALVGELASAHGASVVYAGADESPIAAVRRARPRMVLFDADSALPSATQIAEIERLAPRVVLFGPRRSHPRRGPAARDGGGVHLALPRDLGRLRQLIAGD